jgi:hypothetical protein
LGAVERHRGVSWDPQRLVLQSDFGRQIGWRAGKNFKPNCATALAKDHPE